MRRRYDLIISFPDVEHEWPLFSSRRPRPSHHQAKIPFAPAFSTTGTANRGDLTPLIVAVVGFSMRTAIDQPLNAHGLPLMRTRSMLRNHVGWKPRLN